VSDFTSLQVGFDVPHVTNDMISRFMDVDFALLPGIEASSKSRIGDSDRLSLSLATGAAVGMPLFKGGSTNWEGGWTSNHSQLTADGVTSMVQCWIRLFDPFNPHLLRRPILLLPPRGPSSPKRRWIGSA